MRRVSWGVVIGLVLVWGGFTPAGAQGADTTVAVRGIVMRDTGSAWALFLPEAITVGNVRSHFIHVDGKPGGIDRDENRYVELQGHLRATDGAAADVGVVLDARKLKLMSIPGEGDRSVQRTFMEHAEVAVGILPNRFAFPDSAATDRTRPVITFAISNHSDAPMDFSFRDNKLICSSVLPGDRTTEPIWFHSWSVGPYLTQLQINLSATVREAVTLPDSVTFPPGHYKMRVWLCEAPDYGAETGFDVTK